MDLQVADLDVDHRPLHVEQHALEYGEPDDHGEQAERHRAHRDDGPAAVAADVPPGQLQDIH